MPGDVLSDVLASIRVAGTVYFCDQVQAPWKKEFLGTTAASFHQVRRGYCQLEAGGVTEYLNPGDVVFLEAGVHHVLSSTPVSGESGSEPPDVLLLCGYFEFSQDIDSPVRSLFPTMSILRQEDIQESPWLKATLDQLAAEYLSPLPGAQLVVSRLTEVLVVELIRSNFGQSDTPVFFEAVSDRQIGKALQSLHNNFGKAWTLQSLAEEVGMSRAGLARRFKELVGSPMYEYLTQLRVQKARELLLQTKLPLYEIASRVGYESDISFTKVFKKLTGRTPTQIRRVGSDK